MKNFSRLALIALLMISAIPIYAAQDTTKENHMKWVDAKTLTVEGRGWSNTKSYYDRLPAKAESIVNESVWWLSGDSTGMVIRFVTDSPEIHAKWKLNKPTLALPHMAATGVSGLDLYVKDKGEWHWLAVGKPEAQENEAELISGLPAGKKEYSLYLPLYNGLTDLEIGLSDNATVEMAPARKGGMKPIVFYGTSITQGACASRPGMEYPALIGRKLDVPIINLGFSGSGRGEHEVSDLLAELDPCAYVIDALPNMEADTVYERIGYLLKVLKEKHPNTPVILVEHAIFTSYYNFSKGRKASDSWDVALEKVYKENAPKWNGHLYYVKCDDLMGSDGEATVDGVHCTDVGFMRMEKVLTPVVKKALAK